MKSALFVGLGGFMGSICRFLIVYVVTRWIPGFTSSGTLAVNLLGCFALGMLVHFSTKLGQDYFLFLTAGFCGGFTTFSTFGIENLNLLLNQNYSTALLYMGGSLLFGILAAWMGWHFGRLFIA
ncbi:hypothetical protein BFP72_12015 [Reichenbachiella sp. 5M10]|nr:hypothetical protein BFP72_12015 [Reichenbachiella sp. 5M10]